VAPNGCQSRLSEPGNARRREGAAVDLYIPALALAGLAFLFAAGSVLMSSMVGPKRYNRAKLDSYECGIEPTPQPVGGGRFPVKYYITAMLFIVFDIEIIFLYPWAVHFDAMKYFGLVEMVIFIGTVFVAYVYVWRRGGLDWD
jgi:NADH-quinone oxidoreductase subunit A